MVPTPTLTASASSSAISASDSPDSCWRLSAQNQTPSGRRAHALAERQHEFQKHRQDQRRAEQQRREHGKARNQGIAEPQKAAGGGEHRERQRALVGQPAPLRLLPGVGLGGGEQRQAQRLGQAGGGRRQRAEHADGEAGDPPLRLERQLSRNLRAIEPAQGGRDIGQQRAGDEVAADQADQPRDQRQRHQLEHQHGVEHPRRDAAGAQGAQHRQPLLEGKPDRRIDDEQSDKERQQAERGQVEVKTVGEAFEVALRIRLDQAQCCRRRRFRAARAGPSPCRSAGARADPAFSRGSARCRYRRPARRARVAPAREAAAAMCRHWPAGARPPRA